MDPKFRYELTSLIQSHGGKVTGSVPSVTDYLLKVELDHFTGKCKKAAEKGTAVIGYEDLMSLLRKKWSFRNFSGGSICILGGNFCILPEKLGQDRQKTIR